MGIFEKRANLIRDEVPLLESFIPDSVGHRPGQTQELADCLRPITLQRKPRNAFLYGPCGSGKTLLVQWMLKELEAHSSMARTAYVNCWKRNTTHATLTEILRQLDIFTNYKQGTTELLQLLEKEAKRKSVVVCLDEVDALESKELLYDISRSGMGLVAVSNDPYALMDMDARIKSSVNAEAIEFPAYSTAEIFDILKERAKYAFVPGTTKEAELKMVARMCEGDARVAIETLRRAALLAEDSDKEAIGADEIKRAFKSTQHLRKTEALKKLSGHERALYLILEKHRRLDTVRLFALYKEAIEKPSSQRSYRNYMKHLMQLGLVKGSGELTGRVYEWMI